MEKRKVVMGGWFDLPRLGPEVWSTLVRRQGVVYDKSAGLKFDAGTDLRGRSGRCARPGSRWS